MPTKTSFSQQLRAAIQNDGRSLYAIAVDSGLPRSQISRFMNGKRGLTSASLDKLIEVLEIDLTKRRT